MIPSSDSILRRQIVHRVRVDGQGHRTLELRQRVNVRRTRVTIKSDLEPDNISVLVAGGSGVAMDVFRQMTAAGTWVTVLQRHEDNRKEVREFSLHIFICI